MARMTCGFVTRPWPQCAAFDDFICGQENAAATSTCDCPPACLPDWLLRVHQHLCVRVCVCVLKFEHEIEQRGRNGKFTRTAQGQLRPEGGGGGEWQVFGGWSHDFHLRRRRWPTSSAYFWTCLSCLPKSSGSRWKALTFPEPATASGSAERSTLRPI